MVKALVILLLTIVVFGSATYFTYELYVKPERALRAERQRGPPPPPPDPSLPEFAACLETQKKGDIAAAKEVVGRAVPVEPRVPVEKRIAGRTFTVADAKPFGPSDGPLAMPYVKAATAYYTHPADRAGRYRLLLDLTANETFVDGQFDYHKCRLTFKANGKPLLTQEFVRQGGKA